MNLRLQHWHSHDKDCFFFHRRETTLEQIKGIYGLIKWSQVCCRKGWRIWNHIPFLCATSWNSLGLASYECPSSSPMCVHLRSCYKAGPDHILDHLQILPKTSLLFQQEQEKIKAEKNGTVKMFCITSTLWTRDQLCLTWTYWSPLTWFRNWHICHTRSWDFFSSESRFQSGVDVCKCISICINISWKGYSKNLEPDSSQWDLVKGKERMGANWDAQNYI